jgi:hypothetical protein
MLYKYETHLANFRFDGNMRVGRYKITWYVLEPDDEGEENGRCFNEKELKQFQDYVTQNPTNFPGNKNYWSCSNEELIPYCDFNTEGEILAFPKNLILRKTPELLEGGYTKCMDIILLSTNKIDNHTYDLEFNVVGRVENKD